MVDWTNTAQLAGEIEKHFSLSYYDAICVAYDVDKFYEFEDKDKLRKAAFQYAQRLENS